MMMNSYGFKFTLIFGIILCCYSPFAFAKEKTRSPISFSAGGGVEKNIFYTPVDTEKSGFAFVEVGYNDFYDFLKSGWKFTVDGIYSGKYFFSTSEANDIFASVFMELSDSFGKWELGVSNDPQYTQFVTSDTVGGLLSVGKQRILSDKVRFFGIYNVTNFQEIETGIGFKKKDYRDSDSDYNEWSADTQYRIRFTKSTKFSIGADYEKRNFDDRLSRSASGVVKSSKTLITSRVRPNLKLEFSPTKTQEHSLKYKYLSNKDSDEAWFSYTENSIIAASKYYLNKKSTLSGNARFDFRDYEKKTGDDGSLLKETIVSLGSKLTLPAEFILNQSLFFISFDYSKLDSKINSTDYENISMLLGVTVLL